MFDELICVSSVLLYHFLEPQFVAKPQTCVSLSQVLDDHLQILNVLGELIFQILLLDFIGKDLAVEMVLNLLGEKFICPWCDSVLLLDHLQKVIRSKVLLKHVPDLLRPIHVGFGSRCGIDHP